MSRGFRIARHFPALTRHRHALPVMAELHRGRGAKLVTLVSRTGGSRAAVKQALDHLVAQGWVRKPEGYGHPLRPEYELTSEGARIAGACADIEERLRRRDLGGVLLRRWTLPALAATGAGARRFSEIARALPGATDRALSLALAALVEARLVTRRIADGRPPAVIYAVTALGRASIGDVTP